MRYGDADTVAANRVRFLSKAGVEKSRTVALMEVNHGDAVVCVDGMHAPEAVALVPAEALITNDAQITLTLLTADCLPVGFFDNRTGAMALAHLGWRPIDLGLIGKVVRELSRTYGTHPQDLDVHIGPAISADSYTFPSVSQEGNPEWEPHLLRRDGLVHIDLVGRVVRDLNAAGIGKEKITVSPVDTARSPDHFSHFRSRETGESEGRIMTVLARK